MRDLALDETRNRNSSKISLSIGYVWTERRSRHKNGDGPPAARPAKAPCGGLGPSAVPIGEEHRPRIGVVIVSGETLRRRSREALPRPKVVQFSLTEAEFDEVSEAAAVAGLARGAFAAEVMLAAARGVQARAGSPLREALRELVSAAGLVRRIGTNLNQAVARLNATGQPGEDLVPSAEFCLRVIRRLDEAAEQVRRSIP